MNPEPFTLRELVWAVEARVRDEWSRMSSLIATIANVHRDPKQAPYKPSQFGPFATQTKARRACD